MKAEKKAKRERKIPYESPEYKRAMKALKELGELLGI
jgi:hypothetical protein